MKTTLVRIVSTIARDEEKKSRNLTWFYLLAVLLWEFHGAHKLLMFVRETRVLPSACALKQ